MKYKIILLIALLGVSCNARQNNAKLFFGKLVGQWQMTSIPMIEEWTLSEGQFSSKVYLVTSSDTVVTEQIRLVEQGRRMYYEANVTGHNDDKPVLFRLTEASEERVMFENEEHDFPRQIIYQFISADSLEAIIRGKKDGEANSVNFIYVRIK